MLLLDVEHMPGAIEHDKGSAWIIFENLPLAQIAFPES
jgi:hypothetical protein